MSRDDVVGGTEVESVIVVDVVAGGLLSHDWFVLVAGAKIAVLLSGKGRGPGCGGCGETHHYQVCMLVFKDLRVSRVQNAKMMFLDRRLFGDWRFTYDRRVRAFCAVRGRVYAVVFNR